MSAADELEALLDELEQAEDRERRAAHALAEAEEAAEEDPAARAEVGAFRARLETAAATLAAVRERCRQAETRLGERETVRVRARREGRRPAASGGRRRGPRRGHGG